MENKDLIDTKFMNTILIAKRAKQLIKGAKPMIDFKAENPLTIPIEEFNRGLIHFHLAEKAEKEVLLAERYFAEETDEIPQEQEEPESIE